MALAPYCIYTIVHVDLLDAAARGRTPATFTESKPWVTGLESWQRAKRSGDQVAVLLGDATDCSRLLYWGILAKVSVSGTKTKYTVDLLRRLPKGHTPQDLILRRSGKHIAPNFIRPYAICQTPDFIEE